MNSTMTDDTITITATFEELCTWDSQELAVYATPMTPEADYAAAIYVARGPWYRDDYCLATVEDFCEEAGWDTLGWADMTADEMAQALEQFPPITLTIPRAQPAGEGEERYA
jgi:hypothetical protein